MATVSDVATPIASYHHRDFPLADLRAMKKDQLISVCIPAHDEQATVGAIVETLRRELVDAAGLVDELLVVDDRSEDGTALVARAAGARIVSVPKIDGSAVPTGGKGEAMRRGLGASSGDIVVFLDGDVENFGTHFVTGLLGPILAFPQTVLVKARIANSNDALRQSQFIRARVVWGTHQSPEVPILAVSRLAGQYFAFVAEPQNGGSYVARQKPLKIGQTVGNDYEVQDGIKPGDKVIVSGTQFLLDGAPVIPQS